MTRLRPILVSAFIAVSMCFFACSQHVSWVAVDASDSGDAVKIGIGEELFVDLDANPATGFQWEVLEISDTSVIEKESNEYKASEANATVGSGGVERWTFKALNKGTTRLYLEYSQPWEGGIKEAKTFTLIVVVD